MKSCVGLCSYPKSGNTWVRFLIANIMVDNHSVDYKNINNIIPTGIPDSKLPEAALAGYHFYKAHVPIAEALNIYDKVIYIARNGFDALESYRWFLEKQHPRLFRSDVDFLIGHSRFYGYWGEHYDRDYDRSERVHVVRYEDLKRNSRKEMGAMLEFLGLDMKPFEHRLDVAAENSSRERMQNLPGSSVFMNAARGQTNFVRRGETGKGENYWLDSGFLSEVMGQPGFLRSMERFCYSYPDGPGAGNYVHLNDVVSFYARDLVRKARKAVE